MSFTVNDNLSPDAPINGLKSAINLLASQVKRITGQSDWKIPPTASLNGQIPGTSQIAISTNNGTVGNQQYTEALSSFFTINRAITITHLGAFDSEGNGFLDGVTVELWDVARNVNVVTRFFYGTDGTLINGFRFLPISPVASIPAGQTYAIVGRGFDYLDPNGNLRESSLIRGVVDTGQQAIEFVEARFGGIGVGSNIDTFNSQSAGNINYLAGSFIYTVTG